MHVTQLTKIRHSVFSSCRMSGLSCYTHTYSCCRKLRYILQNLSGFNETLWWKFSCHQEHFSSWTKSIQPCTMNVYNLPLAMRIEIRMRKASEWKISIWGTCSSTLEKMLHTASHNNVHITLNKLNNWKISISTAGLRLSKFFPLRRILFTLCFKVFYVLPRLRSILSFRFKCNSWAICNDAILPYTIVTPYLHRLYILTLQF